MSTVAIVSTVRRPGRDIRGFLDANCKAGVSRAYLFFDDPDDPDLQYVEGDSRVVPLRVTESLRQAQRAAFPDVFCWGDYTTEVMARQIINATWALDLARREGIDWLVHIDADEILHAAGTTLGDLLGEVPADFAQVVLQNLEGAPEKAETAEPFRDITLFKVPQALLGDASVLQQHFRGGRRQGFYFMGYANGKAAVRVSAPAAVESVHRFRRPDGRPLRSWVLDRRALVLHYINPGFSQFRFKIKRLRQLRDELHRGEPYLLRSRDIFRLGDEQALRRFYRETALWEDAAEVLHLIQSCALERIEAVREMLYPGNPATSPGRQRPAVAPDAGSAP